jgi:hypothetical protein
MRPWLETLNYWKIAFLLCGIMYVSTVVSTFMAVSETWSDETWAGMGWFLKLRFMVVCMASGIPVIIAFLNKTMARLEEGKPLVNPGDTRFVKREEVTTTVKQ